jgi:uncharacterized surface protein with fasciclin (FAS1) repeats
VPTFAQTLVTPDIVSSDQPFTGITGGQYNGLVKNGESVQVLSGELSVSNVTQAVSIELKDPIGQSPDANKQLQDIRLGNGIIIHVIDRALMFGPPFALFLVRAGYTAMASAIETAQLNVSLGNQGADEGNTPNTTDITLFVPSTAAFESIGSVLQTANQSIVQEVLGYHILTDNVVFSPSLGNFTAPTYQGGDLTFTVLDDGTTFVNEARIIFPNIIGFNGVIHIIDRSV